MKSSKSSEKSSVSQMPMPAPIPAPWLLLPWLLLFFLAGEVTGGGGPQTRSFSNVTLSLTPPRGWNSYDSFSWIITEDEFMQNAEYVAANLLEHGYEYVVVDFLWYRKLEPGAEVWTPGHDIVDEWGRLVPDPTRWPSTAGGKGFKPIAEKVHAMGLKFGIHVMRGISGAAVDSNAPILCAKDCPDGFADRNWTASEIIVPGGWCSWMWNCFIRVNHTTEGGRAFTNSLYAQYAEWGVDFIKLDCVFGVDDLAIDEITEVGKAIESTGRPMVYSLSPGVAATPEMGSQVAQLSHMYRVTADDWDTWAHVYLHFTAARDFAAAGLIGAPGLWGSKSWPDLDMLPIGWLTDPGVTYGAYRPTNLSKDEQRTQITLWAMAKSPIMFGGDLRNMDQWTYELITQPVVLEINAYSVHNRELSSSEPSSLPDIALQECASSSLAASVLWSFKSEKRNSHDGNELCWSQFPNPTYSKGAGRHRRRAMLTGCLSWTDASPALSSLLDGDVHVDSRIKESRRRGQLWSSMPDGVICLEVNSSRSSKDMEDGSNTHFSRCRSTASQVWLVTPEGSLVNEGNGRCAVVKGSANEWKIWVARGLEGQTYVAFFNLGSEVATLTVDVEDVMNFVSSNSQYGYDDERGKYSQHRSRRKRLDKVYQPVMSFLHRILRRESTTTLGGGRGLEQKQSSSWSCMGLDVWNNKIFRGNMTKLEASVESHGTALFQLTCVR